MRSIAGMTICLSCALVGVAIRPAAHGRSEGQAQGQAPAPGRGGQTPTNLQVLPKDLTTVQVTRIMRTFTVGLGVQCDHCHVSQQDRASDDKKEKKTARKMLQMVMAINDQYLKDVGEPPAAVMPPAPEAPPAPGALPALPAQKVTCYTCHRGATKPLTAPPAGGGY
jgi:hypothetical protein